MVKVRFKCLSTEIFDEVGVRIQPTEFQDCQINGSDNGISLVEKDFRVYDPEAFRTAVQFKAACNYANHMGRHAPTLAALPPKEGGGAAAPS